jgi:hypothetical protein
MVPKTDKWKRTTIWLLGVLTVLVIVYDTLVAFFNDEKGDTISRIMQAVSDTNWSLPFAMGALFIGHFFLYGKPAIAQPWGFIVLVGVFGILLTLDLLGLTPKISPVVLLIIGAVAGKYLFPMTPI